MAVSQFKLSQSLRHSTIISRIPTKLNTEKIKTNKNGHCTIFNYHSHTKHSKPNERTGLNQPCLFPCGLRIAQLQT